jgi:hypothetical protein
VRLLPVAYAVLFLRLLVHSLRGVCGDWLEEEEGGDEIEKKLGDSHGINSDNNRIDPRKPGAVASSSSFSAGENEPQSVDSLVYSDEQVKRASGWIEALLDGHFNSIALKANSDSSTRRALFQAMRIVSSADKAAQQLQQLLGQWSHIYRVVHHKGEQVKPPPGLYEIEQITL